MRVYNTWASLSFFKTLGKCLIISCAFISVVLVARLHAIDTPTFHLDGAFQTASGLYRLHTGQFPGRDFYPYLGIGPLYLLYPIFAITGHNMASSVFSAYFSVILVSVIVFAIIWQLIWRHKRIIDSFVAASCYILFILSLQYIFHLSLPGWLTWSIQPGNSLRPLRNFAPYLVIISLFFLATRKNIRGINSALTFGIIIGFIALWSNDFAIPTALLFIILLLFRKKEEGISLLKIFIQFSLSALFSSIILLSLTTHGHFIEMFRYNFFDVASDQWWYFGPYDPAERIFSIKDIYKLFSAETYFPFFTLLIVLFSALRYKTHETILLLWIGVVLFSGGMLASIGGHIGGYFGGFYFWGALTTIIGFYKIIHNKVSQKQPLILQQILFVFPIVLMISAVTITTSLWRNFIISSETARNDSNRFYVPKLGGYLPITWKEYVDLANQSSHKIAFEEYWGIWSALEDTKAILPIDAAIHALGHTRDAAKSEMNDAEIITTTRHSFSGDWQSWNLSQNYWLYEILFEHYTPFFYSPNTIVWKKTYSRPTVHEVTCQIDTDKKSITIKSSPKSFVEVTVEYESSTHKRTLLLAENNINYGGDANGYVSINPYASSARFPVYTQQETSHLFSFIPIPMNTPFAIKNCSAKKILLTDPEVLALPDSSFYSNLTDPRWDHGISREHAGFLLPNRLEFRQKFSLGKTVILPNGDRRTILWTHEDKQLYSVVISGNVLQADTIEYPTTLMVMGPITESIPSSDSHETH